MANYNANAMAAYQQYGQTMAAGGGGSNMSGTGSSTMQVFNAVNDNDDDRPSGLASRPTTTEDKKPSFWDKITSVFQQNEVDVTNVYKPSVDPSNVYTQEMFEMVPAASDYVYRAEMSEQTQDAVEQAMGYEVPKLGQLQKIGEGSMSAEEQKQFAPLIKLADDIRNNNITSTELPSVLSNNQIKDLANKAIKAGTFSRNNVDDDIFYQNLLTAITKGTNPLLDEEGNVVQGEPYTLDQPQGEPYTLDEEASLMDALMEGQPTGLMSRPSSFTGGSVDVASNIPNWMQDLSAAELTDVLVGINQGTHDPETGQPIQSAEDVARETTEEFNARRRRERGLPPVAPTNGDVVDTALTKLSDNTSMSKSTIVDQVTDLVGKNIYAASILGAFEKETGTNFTILEENLNYSLANAKAVPFSQAKINRALASLSESDRAKVKAGRNVEAFGKALMDEAYSGGSDYKGRGLIQITHDYNYEAVGDRIGVDLVSNPELVNDPRYAVPAALAYLDLQGFFDEEPTKDSLHRMINPRASTNIKNQRWSAATRYLDQIKDTGGSSDSSPRPRLR